MKRGTRLLEMAMADPLWSENDTEWFRGELQSIPDWHVRGLAQLKILTDFSQFKDDKWQGYPGVDWINAAGAYRYQPKELMIRSQKFGPGLVSHEVGHHLLYLLPQIQTSIGSRLNFWDGLVKGWQRMQEIENRQCDWKEFFAEFYMLIAAEDQTYWQCDVTPTALSPDKYPDRALRYWTEFEWLAERIQYLIQTPADEFLGLR